jgi:hypothetical protein
VMYSTSSMVRSGHRRTVGANGHDRWIVETSGECLQRSRQQPVIAVSELDITATRDLQHLLWFWFEARRDSLLISRSPPLCFDAAMAALSSDESSSTTAISSSTPS